MRFSGTQSSSSGVFGRFLSPFRWIFLFFSFPIIFPGIFSWFSHVFLVFELGPLPGAADWLWQLLSFPKALCQAWQENHDFLWGCGCRSPEKCGISHVLVESRGGRSSRKWARNHLDSGKNPSRCVLIWGFNLGLHPNCYLNGGQSGGPIWF